MSDTVDGRKTLREHLRVERLSPTRFIVVDVKRCRFLCITHKKGDFLIRVPVEWQTCGEAEKWRQDGYIAEIQEQLSTLGVGFYKRLVKRRKCC